MILGGGILSSYSSSIGIGINPAAASGTVILDNRTTGGVDSFQLSVGDYIVYSFGAMASFTGVVNEIGESWNDPTSGQVQSFGVVDNRVRLQWQEVFGVWNMEDDIFLRSVGRPGAPMPPGDSSSHGGDGVTIGGGVDGGSSSDSAGTIGSPDGSGARRKYWSILPRHWAGQIKTWHDEPFNAREILNFAFADAWGDFGFSRNYHSSLSTTIIYGLDCNNGIKLSNLISSINEKAGLELGIYGDRGLFWVRKGEGLVPIPDDHSKNISSGECLTTVDTGVRVVGERIRIQVANVELEPDWKSGWEAFIEERAWRFEVARVLDLPTDDDKYNQAVISQKARQLTVGRYAALVEDESFLDGRMFGRSSRNYMPAWLYIQELVFRSYRIPTDETLYGIPLSSLEMADSLIASTDIHGEGPHAYQDYVSNPVEWYPQAQAQVVHKGQPIDIITSRDMRLMYVYADTLRDQWTAAANFEVDPVMMSIRFASPVFIDGLPAAGKSLYLKINTGQGGGPNLSSAVVAGSDYLDVVVPNPDAVISPAGVKASFCFLMGKYHKDYGVGPRRGTMVCPGLGLHLLDTKGTGEFAVSGVEDFSGSSLPFPDTGDSTFLEVLYQDGKGAAYKAQKAADSLLGLSPVQASGGFTRHGLVSTGISGVVDRVTVNIDMNGGVTEQITYTKARATGIAFSEKTLQRIQQTSEVYPGQDALKNEAKNYRLQAQLAHAPEKHRSSSTHKTMADVFTRPIGSDNHNIVSLHDKNSAAPARGKWLAGDIVWLDEQGYPSKTGDVFGGVVVMTPKMDADSGSQVKDLTVANSGLVPMLVESGIASFATVYGDTSSDKPTIGHRKGKVVLGHLAHGEPTPDITSKQVYAMVQLGKPSREHGKFTVSFDYSAQRVNITAGAVQWIVEKSTEALHPEIPTLDDVDLGEEDAYWDASEFSADKETLIVVRLDKGACEMQIFDPEEPDEEDHRPPFVIASIKLASEGGLLKVDTLVQEWESDIVWKHEHSSSSGLSSAASDWYPSSGGSTGGSHGSAGSHGDSTGGSHGSGDSAGSHGESAGGSHGSGGSTAGHESGSRGSSGGSSSGSSGSGSSGSSGSGSSGSSGSGSSGSSGSGSSGSSGGSSGGTSGSGQGSGSGGSSRGSDKSTAIVPMPWHASGYGAMFTMESNQVLFEFVMRDVVISGEYTSVLIDARFYYVCERGTICVSGAPCGDTPDSVGAEVKCGTVILRASKDAALRPRKVSLKLTGVRRGFRDFDMPPRSHAQFVANEEFLNSAYPVE